MRSLINNMMSSFDVNRFNDVNMFKKWLTSKGDNTFCYNNNDYCCFAQWAIECGDKRPLVGHKDIWIGGDENNFIDIPDLYIKAMDPIVNGHAPNKFSEVLKRLEEVVGGSKV